MKPEAQRELLMMLFANTQTQIQILDEMPNTTFFTQGYKSLCKKMQAANIEKIDKLFGKMDTFGDDRKYFEYAFRKSQDVSEQIVKCIENHSLETLLVMLKALNDGQLLQMDEGKHKKMMSQLKPLEI